MPAKRLWPTMALPAFALPAFVLPAFVLPALLSAIFSSPGMRAMAVATFAFFLSSACWWITWAVRFFSAMWKMRWAMENEMSVASICLALNEVDEKLAALS